MYLAAFVHIVANECAAKIRLSLDSTFFQDLINLLHKWSKMVAKLRRSYRLDLHPLC